MSSRQAARLADHYVSAEGIDRSVIQSEIQRYLGNDATCALIQTTNGPMYRIRAVRNFTNAQLDDIKALSLNWASESRQAQSTGHNPGVYGDSRTMARQYDRRQYGETTAQPDYGRGYEGQPSYTGQAGNSGPYANAYSGSGAATYGQQAYTTDPQEQASRGQYQPSAQAPRTAPYSADYQQNPQAAAPQNNPPTGYYDQYGRWVTFQTTQPQRGP